MKETGIIFNAEMVRAIPDGRKTKTRRIINPQPEFRPHGSWHWGYPDRRRIPNGPRGVSGGCKTSFAEMVIEYCPYSIGDLLYVKETHVLTNHGDPVFRADFRDRRGNYWSSIACDPAGVKWHSAMLMPKRVARLWLEITHVRVERVQDIDNNDALAEGTPDIRTIENNFDMRDCFRAIWDSIYAKPRPVKTKGVVTHYVSYPWEAATETRTHRGKPWYVYGNPWVFAYTFRLQSKESKP
jgi:hypothetical protein